MTDYGAVLIARYADSRWALYGDDYDGLEWLDDSPMPSQAELDAAWPAVQEERAWAAVRAERDRLLADSDWTQVADAPVDPAPWAVYRQALRDIPQDFNSPADIIWPEQP